MMHSSNASCNYAKPIFIYEIIKKISNSQKTGEIKNILSMRNKKGGCSDD